MRSLFADLGLPALGIVAVMMLILVILGTFITRSGIVSSVHSFILVLT